VKARFRFDPGSSSTKCCTAGGLAAGAFTLITEIAQVFP